MKSFTTAVSTLLFVASALGQTFMLNTPSGPIQCQPILLTWTSGGNPPFILSILPANQPSAQPLEQYTGLTGTSFTWNTNIQAGTQVGLTLRDSTGASSSTAPVTINSSGDSSCLTSASGGGVSSTGSASGSGSSSSGASTTPSGTSTSAHSTTPVTTPTTSAGGSTPVSTPGGSTSTPAGSSSGSSSAPPTSSSGSASGGSSSGAVAKVASAGIAALVGGFVAAVLA